jgi:muramoyltetrapeptide carboxypeptidase
MPLRFPPPLRPGDRIGVTSPSSGVPADLLPRLDFCVQHLERQGYQVVVGSCMSGDGVVSAPAQERADELMQMLIDPAIGAVVPPWGGELAVEVIPHLDLAALREAQPTWLVGWSDMSTLLLPLTTVAGVATLHGGNLMDTPYQVPEPLAHWLEAAATEPGGTLTQGPSAFHRPHGHDPWQDDPTFPERTLDTPGGWSLLDPGMGDVRVSGRLIGGCLETVSILAGTRWGDVRQFAEEHAPEGLIVYVEASEDPATDIARHLWRLRLAGWFERANAVLVGRTSAPDSEGFTQLDAVRSGLGDLGVPVVLDVDCGHVPPHLALVNGALAEVTLTRLVQQLR